MCSEQVALAERKESQKSMFELIKKETLKDSPSHAKMVEEYLELRGLKSSPEKGTSLLTVCEKKN